jgi:uncharacterized protein (UPF0332 family)
MTSSSPFDPAEFYRVASELNATHASDEAYLRTAIGRSYYACFHLARSGLERNGRWTAGTLNAHERVAQELRARGRHAMANGLRSLRRLRERADYDLTEPVGRAIAEQALHQAAALLRVLATY